MNIDSIKSQLLSLFSRSKKYRHRFLSNHLSLCIASQIFYLRTDQERNWTQTELAKKASIPQPRITVYESSEYGGYSLNTLKKLARAFDVALSVRFISFSELAHEIANRSTESTNVSTFKSA